MKQSKREKQTEAPVEEPKEQPAQEQAPGDVDPMDFLEESEPFNPALATAHVFDGNGVETVIPASELPPDSELGQLAQRFATGGIVPAGDPVLVGETVIDCHVERIPPSLLEKASLEIGGTQNADGSLNVTEVSMVETLHAPHGTSQADYVQNPLLPKGATVTPKRMATSGCGHGHANSVLCPQCRANRKP
jgi:hypothetical protein